MPKTFPGSLYDGYILNELLEQPRCYSKTSKQIIFDLGFRGVDTDNPEVKIIYNDQYKSLTEPQQCWLKRR